MRASNVGRRKARGRGRVEQVSAEGGTSRLDALDSPLFISILPPRLAGKLLKETLRLVRQSTIPPSRHMKASYPKYLLTRIGARTSKLQLYKLQALVNHMKLGRWMRDHDYHFDRPLPDRWDV